MEETPIKRYLKSMPHNEEVHYFPNPGGVGDSLIACAAYQLFSEAGIRYRIVKVGEDFDPRGKIMLYGGGGNLVEYYSTARRLIQKYHPLLKRLVILPHTIRANEDLLSEFGTNVDVICREPVSFAHVKKYAPHANILLMDDLAFSLDVWGIVKKDSFLKDRRIRTLMWRDFLIGILLPFKQLPGKIFWPNAWGTLNAFRKDVESLRHPVAPDNVDLATLFGYGTDSEALAFYVSRRALRLINRYRVVRTDRLHICIAAAMLGKEVEFFPNNYYKCEAVYQYSIKGKFPNVSWMG